MKAKWKKAAKTSKAIMTKASAKIMSSKRRKEINGEKISKMSSISASSASCNGIMKSSAASWKISNVHKRNEITIKRNKNDSRNKIKAVAAINYESISRIMAKRIEENGEIRRKASGIWKRRRNQRENEAKKSGSAKNVRKNQMCIIS